MTLKLNEFSVREKLNGGGVSRVVRRRGSDLEYRSPKLIILIHGFNVPQERAAESLAGFWGRLSFYLGATRHEAPPAWAFYWPGDHESRKLSAATYAARIAEAELAGERLGKLLTKLQPAQQVILIGHSLGCRVLLEALRYAADARAENIGSAGVPVACLLAAAVPIGRCAGAEPYSPAVIENNVHALHSRKDRILQITFPIGQRIYGESKGEAVGRNGGPPNRWGTPHEMRLGHTDYLSAPEAAAEVARIIDPGLPRVIASRYLAEEELPESRMLESRGLPSRSLGDDPESAWVNCWPIAGDVGAVQLQSPRGRESSMTPPPAVS